MSRDPRVDPRPGDVVSTDPGLDYEVTKVTRCFVFNRGSNGGFSSGVARISLRRWRAWAKTATVIKLGDTP